MWSQAILEIQGQRGPLLIPGGCALIIIITLQEIEHENSTAGDGDSDDWRYVRRYDTRPNHDGRFAEGLTQAITRTDAHQSEVITPLGPVLCRAFFEVKHMIRSDRRKEDKTAMGKRARAIAKALKDAKPNQPSVEAKTQWENTVISVLDVFEATNMYFPKKAWLKEAGFEGSIVA